MSHIDETPERPSLWRRAMGWLTETYDESLSIAEQPGTIELGCPQCPWSHTVPDDEGGRELVARMLEVHRRAEHAPDLADDLPHVADAVRREPEVRRRASTTQQRMVEAVLSVLDEHGVWLHEHPDTPQRERVQLAQRVVFRAVQAGISVVRPVAERDARRAALAEAADYVAQQRSVIEAAEGLRRHLGEEALPMRPERYPVAVHAARTTGPMAVVPPAAPPHLVGLPTAVVDGEHAEVIDVG